MDVFFDWRWWHLLEKYNTIWEKVSPDINKNLIMSISIINILWKWKQILMVIKWQIFLIKKFLKFYFWWWLWWKIAVRLMFFWESKFENLCFWEGKFGNVFFWESNLKMHFLRGQFQNIVFWESTFKKAFF